MVCVPEELAKMKVDFNNRWTHGWVEFEEEWNVYRSKDGKHIFFGDYEVCSGQELQLN